MSLSKHVDKKTGRLKDKLMMSIMSADLEGAVCGSPTKCTGSNMVRRELDGAPTFAKTHSNITTITFNGVIYHYATPPALLKVVEANDDGTLTLADVKGGMEYKIIDSHKSYQNVSPERYSQIRESEKIRRKEGTIKKYPRGPRYEAALRAGKAKKRLMSGESVVRSVKAKKKVTGE